MVRQRSCEVVRAVKIMCLASSSAALCCPMLYVTFEVPSETVHVPHLRLTLDGTRTIREVIYVSNRGLRSILKTRSSNRGVREWTPAYSRVSNCAAIGRMAVYLRCLGGSFTKSSTQLNPRSPFGPNPHPLFSRTGVLQRADFPRANWLEYMKSLLEHKLGIGQKPNMLIRIGQPCFPTLHWYLIFKQSRSLFTASWIRQARDLKSTVPCVHMSTQSTG